jgi:predicted fused transcriptional regulator/phosphomethylpyrimidine kinase
MGLDYKFNLNLKSEDDPVLFSFKKFLEENEVPTILIDKDREGFEPVCYIFANNPIEVAKLAVEIANEYSNLI